MNVNKEDECDKIYIESNGKKNINKKMYHL